MKKTLLFLFFTVSLGAYGVPKDSLYNLNSEWTSNKGENASFGKFQNEKYKVVTMIFTSCPAACPLMVGHLKQLDGALNKEQKKNVEYLLFSIDPLDTVEQMDGFHKKFGLDSRFRFYKGSSEDDIQELAAVLGFKYKKIDDSMYSHGTDVYLLNPDGQVVEDVGKSYKAKDLAAKIPAGL